jgi:putative peptidoglycan lipid II flippase
MGPVGLAAASDIGILLQTAVLAILLHRRGMVSLGGLDYGEIARGLLAGLVSLAALVALRHFVHTTSRLWELALLAGAFVVWVAVSFAVLRVSGSSLPGELRARFASRG